MTVEPMRWWHVPEVAELESSLFPVDAWSVEQFWQELAHDTRRYAVATDDHRVVGYAGVFLLPPDGDLQTIAVRRDRQGEGVATALLAALVDQATSRGCTHLLLEVRADNAAAIGLYDRFGFEQISRRPRYYPDGVDALILRAPLGAQRVGGDVP